MKNVTLVLSCTVLLLVAYVTSYSLNVQRGNGWFFMHLVGHFDEGQKLPISASYRFGGRWAQTIYFPLQKLDRHVRPEYWNFTFHDF